MKYLNMTYNELKGIVNAIEGDDFIAREKYCFDLIVREGLR